MGPQQDAYLPCRKKGAEADNTRWGIESVQTAAKAASKFSTKGRLPAVERPIRSGTGFPLPETPDFQPPLPMEQRLNRIEEMLAALTRQLGMLPTSPSDSRALPLPPMTSSPDGATARSRSVPAPRVSRSTVEAVLLPDLARAEAGLRAYDLPGRRAAAVFLDGHGGRVYVYDQEGRPLRVEG